MCLISQGFTFTGQEIPDRKNSIGKSVVSRCFGQNMCVIEILSQKMEQSCLDGEYTWIRSHRSSEEKEGLEGQGCGVWVCGGVYFSDA